MHESVAKSRKRARARESSLWSLHNNHKLQQEACNAARRIHEMHLIIKRLSPRETTRDCPYLPVQRVHALRTKLGGTKKTGAGSGLQPVCPPCRGEIRPSSR